jgi:hypothetical protein
MSGDGRRPSGLDVTKPNVARIYDYLLGGKDNFAADRAAATKIMEAAPVVVQRTRENRAFLGRVVRHLAESAIDQFLDLGTGLPTQHNVHEVAQSVAPASHVVYVDNDPVVISHGKAILENNGRTVVLQADMRNTSEILEHPELRQLIDFSRPVAVLMVAVLHFLAEGDRPHEIVNAFCERLAPGSYLVVSHASAGAMKPDNLTQAVQTYATTSIGSITPRSSQRIESFFDGLELQEPGVVPVAQWRPEGILPPSTPGPAFLGGVGRKV